MTFLYATRSEIKTYMDISGSSKDAKIDQLNKIATKKVDNILSVNSLALHKVSKEIHDGATGEYDLRDYNIRKIGEILEDENEVYSQDKAYDFDKYTLYLENITRGAERDVKISYAAGYDAAGFAFLDVKDYSDLGGVDVTVDGNTKTEGTDWDAKTDNATTASNLAAAIDNITDIRSFVAGNRVYVIQNDVQASGKSISTTANSDDLSLSSSSLDGVDFPEQIKFAVKLFVADLFRRGDKANVNSYTIGSKTVQFNSGSDFQMFKSSLKPFIRANIQAI